MFTCLCIFHGIQQAWQTVSRIYLLYFPDLTAKGLLLNRASIALEVFIFHLIVARWQQWQLQQKVAAWDRISGSTEDSGSTRVDRGEERPSRQQVLSKGLARGGFPQPGYRAERLFALLK